MEGADRISFLGVRCPAGFRLGTLTLLPDDAVDYRRGDWLDALVVIERGQLEVECHSGTRACFVEGAVLALAGLPLRRLRNPGDVPLVLSVLSRAE